MGAEGGPQRGLCGLEDLEAESCGMALSNVECGPCCIHAGQVTCFPHAQTEPPPQPRHLRRGLGWNVSPVKKKSSCVWKESAAWAACPGVKRGSSLEPACGQPGFA